MPSTPGETAPSGAPALGPLAARLRGWATGPDAFAFWVLAIALAYTIATLTPSSYGLALQIFGAGAPGLLFGTPQPLRSDEWAVWTPYVQMAVNNDFLRINATSVYGEDLRNFNALPLLDWGLALKPQFWAFFVLPAPWAFSFYHAFVIVAFLIGWERAFRLLGFDRTIAALVGSCLFFAPYTQLWWTTTGPLLAFFPWLLVIYLSDMGPIRRAALMAWASAVFVLGHLYPPVLLTIAFAGALLIVALAPRTLRQIPRVASAGIGAGVGVALSLLYLQEQLAIMTSTVYPGSRSLEGGGLPIWQWWAQFFPDLVTSQRETLIGLNYLEVATGGTYFLMFVWAFLIGRPGSRAPAQAVGKAPGHAWFALAPIGIGLAMMTAWMILPVPAWLGHFLLWDIIPPQRFVFAFGLLLLVGAVIVAERAGQGAHLWRAVLCALVLAAIFAWSRSRFGGSALDATGLAVGLVVFLGAMFWRGRRVAVAGLMGALAAGVVGYGGFNPVQLAGPIFWRPATAATKALDAQQASNPDGWLVAPGYPGALLNGWGYKSISHVLIAPKMDFFRARFPEMSDAEFNHVFNRYAHVQLFDGDTPDTPQGDVLRVPIKAFAPQADWTAPNASIVRRQRTAAIEQGGYIDNLAIDAQAGTVTLVGWGLMDPAEAGVTLQIFAPWADRVVKVDPIMRPDVAAALGDGDLVRSGFAVTLAIREGARADVVCIASSDPKRGARALDLPKGAALSCPR